MIAPSFTLKCRSCLPTDAGYFAQLYTAVHVGEFASLGLPDAVVDNLLRMQSQSQEMDYQRRFPDARRLIIECDGQRVGRMVIDDRADCLHLVDIAIEPEYQGRGIGTELLQGLIQESAGRPIRLHVLSHNPALRLYERLGFQIVTEKFPYFGMEYSQRAENELTLSNASLSG